MTPMIKDAEAPARFEGPGGWRVDTIDVTGATGTHEGLSGQPMLEGRSYRISRWGTHVKDVRTVDEVQKHVGRDYVMLKEVTRHEQA